MDPKGLLSCLQESAIDWIGIVWDCSEDIYCCNILLGLTQKLYISETYLTSSFDMY
jgi:hypothetical protein